jgi:hypothetical protein
LQLDPTSVVLIEPLQGSPLLSVVYRIQKKYFVKRFIIDKQVLDKKYHLFFLESDTAKVMLATSSLKPTLQLHYLVHPPTTSNDKQSILYDLEKIAIKTIKAKGTLLSKYMITQVDFWNA